MTPVELAVIVTAGCAIVVITLAFLNFQKAILRSAARERDLLINQLLHATGKPWVEPPAAAARRDPAQLERLFTATPEQEPIG